MFWTYEVPLFRLSVAKLSLVNFFGYCFCITQFIPRCTHAGCYTGNLLLKLSHPPLPLKGQSHALVLEYLVKNTFTTVTVKSTPKKKKMHTTAGTVCIWQSDIFCVFHTSGEGNWSLEEKAYICQLFLASHIYFLSLSAVLWLTTGNKFLKQKARSEDPWGVYIVRSAAWASHKPLFSKAGCCCRNFLKSKILYPHHKWSWGIKIQTGGGSKLSVPGAIHPWVRNSAEATLLSPILVKAGLGITAIPA